MKEDFIRLEGTYFEMIYTNSNNTTLFKELLDKKNKSGAIDYLKLITGLQNISHLRPSYELWELSRLIRHSEHKSFYLDRSSEEICDTYLNTKAEFPFRSEIEAIIKKYSYKSEKELNILVCHHHPYKMVHLENNLDTESMDGGDSLGNILIESDKGPWLIIHGHKHIPQIRYAPSPSSMMRPTSNHLKPLP